MLPTVLCPNLRAAAAKECNSHLTLIHRVSVIMHINTPAFMSVTQYVNTPAFMSVTQYVNNAPAFIGVTQYANA